MRGTLILATLAAAATAVAAPDTAAAQDATRWSWNKRLAAGKAIEIKGVNGEIRALPAEGGEVVVRAEKHGRRDDPEEVTIEVVEHAGGVTICAVYPTPRGSDEPNECAPGGGGRMSTRNNDVQVDFTVYVPADNRLVARTVNGGIEADRLGSDVDASTVNGGITLSTRGRAEARTVNGSIRAAFADGAWRDDLDFKTVNGSITLEVPASFNADIVFKTLNGEIETDFPITVNGRVSRRELNGTIGSGGRELRAETVNGSVRLRKS